MNANEAVAYAAMQAHVAFFSHYPGSPVNLVEPALKTLNQEKNLGIIFNDSFNEHIAVLAAAGASFSNSRSLVVMKHVGMNIGADPMSYLAYTGIQGGMCIVVGTDPGANASTNELDVHAYAKMFGFPLLEPASVQEVFDLVYTSFSISEKYQLPILCFIPTALAYHAASVNIHKGTKQSESGKPYFKKDKERYINAGFRSVNHHQSALDRLKKIAIHENRSVSLFNPDAEIGIICRGSTVGFCYESILRLEGQQSVHLLIPQLVFPLPDGALRDFLKHKKKILIVEDQDGFLESQIKMEFFEAIEGSIAGKSIFPQYGQVTFDQAFEAIAGLLGKPHQSPSHAKPEIQVPERLGTFCEGCPHRSVFYALDKISEEYDCIIGGDIGCSSLPPYRADWLMCMNAGIGISQGIAQVSKDQLVISTGGDGSFFHGGLLSLFSAVQNQVNLIHLVLDNESIAMTGHQASPSSQGGFDPKALLHAIGVKQVHILSANQPKQLIKKLRQAAHKKGVKVFWIKGVCSRLPNRWRDRKTKFLNPSIKAHKCMDCSSCYHELACPAIDFDRRNPNNLGIDLSHCMRCGSCRNMCPNGAIQADIDVKNLLRSMSKNNTD